MNHWSVRAFNEMWFRKAPRHRRAELQGIAGFFHPLDGVGDWNRLYGPRGLVQYQFVVPDEAEAALTEAVERIAAAGHASFLAVLKRFGPGNAGWLSFPRAGWTLALDLPADPRLAPLLDGLDALVVEAGGRLYLAKDSRARAETLHRMYPRLDDLRALRRRTDPAGVLTSDLARRLLL
jgi:decaprenylphospho-beta-D-ribofuranose 2-oxidase